jgi:hypothetical protein
MTRHAIFPACLILLTFSVIFQQTLSWADTDTLPKTVIEQVNTPLETIGQGTYRKLGFKIYDASLWAETPPWDSSKPYALQLRYARSLSKETLVDAVMDDIVDQGVADEATRARWKEKLNTTLRDVEENDVLIGVALPGKTTSLFFNGEKIASIEDQAFSDAFFAVWLGDTADETLRRKLLGQAP